MQILQISSTGELRNAFAKEGKGPGEITRSSKLVKSHSNFVVQNTDRSTLSFFSPDGELVKTVPITIPASLNADMAVQDDRLLMSIANNSEGIASVVSLDDMEDGQIHLGDTTYANMPSSLDFEKFNSKISNQEIPDAFKDDTITLFDNKQNAYLVYRGDNRVQKYNLDGELLWDKQIPLSELETILENFFSANDSGGSGFRRITPIDIFTHALHNNDSLFLYSHVGSEEGSIVLEIDDKTGNLINQIKLPNVKFKSMGFSYDYDSDAFYFLDSNSQNILKVTR